MKQLKILLFFAFIAFYTFAAKVDDELFYVRFQCLAESKHSIRPNSNNPIQKAAPDDRVGNFIVSGEDVPDSLISCIKVAAQTWGAQLQNKVPIKISVCFAELDRQIAYIGDAMYKQNSTTGSVPVALAAQASPIYSSLPAHILITLNKNVEWNCDMIANRPSQGMNIYSCALRAIANGLGFGTSLVVSQGQMKYSGSYPSVFDRAIFYNNTYLKDLKVTSAEFKSFVEREYVNVFSEDYRLYTCNPYIEGLSLSYLNKPSCLMLYDFGSGDKFFNIDNTTIDILKKLDGILTIASL